MKDSVYSTLVSNVTQLSRQVTSAIHSKRAEVLQNVWKTSDERRNEEERQTAGHTEHW